MRIGVIEINRKRFQPLWERNGQGMIVGIGYSRPNRQRPVLRLVEGMLTNDRERLHVELGRRPVISVRQSIVIDGLSDVRVAGRLALRTLCRDKRLEQVLEVGNRLNGRQRCTAFSGLSP